MEEVVNKMKIRELLKKFAVVLPALTLGILAVAGSNFKAVTPFVETVIADEYGSDDDDDTPVITEEQRREIDYRASEAGKTANDQSVSNLSIGNMNMSGGTQVGGGVSKVFDSTPTAQKVQATGANLNAGEISYSKVEPVSAAAKMVYASAATAQGFLPGGVMKIEIGNFTTAGGYKPCDKLTGAFNIDTYIRPIPGYTPGIMMFLPDGTSRLLNANEFDASYATHDFASGDQLYVIRTTVPNATYMTVYMPNGNV